MQVSQPLGGCLPRRFPALLPHPHSGSARLPPPALTSSSSPATAPAAAWALRQQQMPGAKICILRPRRTPEDESRTPRRAGKEGTEGAAVPPKRQQPPPPPEGSEPAERLPAAVAAAAGGPLSPTMPGPATGGGKVPFRNAKEEIRAGVEGPEGGGAQERPGARGQRQNIVWRNVVLMSLLHLGAVYSLVLIPKAKPLTLLWGKSAGAPAPRTLARGVAGRPLATGGAERLRGPLTCDRPPLGRTGIPVQVLATSASPGVAPSRRLCRLGMPSGRGPESCGATSGRRGA